MRTWNDNQKLETMTGQATVQETNNQNSTENRYDTCAEDTFRMIRRIMRRKENENKCTSYITRIRKGISMYDLNIK